MGARVAANQFQHRLRDGLKQCRGQTRRQRNAEPVAITGRILRGDQALLAGDAQFASTFSVRGSTSGTRADRSMDRSVSRYARTAQSLRAQAARRAGPRPGAPARMTLTSLNVAARPAAVARVPSLPPPSAIVTRALNGKLLVRKACSRMMLRPGNRYDDLDLGWHDAGPGRRLGGEDGGCHAGSIAGHTGFLLS